MLFAKKAFATKMDPRSSPGVTRSTAGLEPVSALVAVGGEALDHRLAGGGEVGEAAADRLHRDQRLAARRRAAKNCSVSSLTALAMSAWFDRKPRTIARLEFPERGLGVVGGGVGHEAQGVGVDPRLAPCRRGACW